MNDEQFREALALLEKTGFPGLCDRASPECQPDRTATRYVRRNEKETYLYCDTHAPKDAVAFNPLNDGFDPFDSSNLTSTLAQLSGGTSASKSSSAGNQDALESASRSLAGLRSSLSNTFGVRLQSAGATPDDAVTRVILETIGASPTNPFVVNFTQFIPVPFSGPGQFDLVERDSRRRSVGGASAGGTNVLTDLSRAMNWSSEDEGRLIRIGRNHGQVFKISTVLEDDVVTLSRNIALPASGLTLTMDGSEESQVTLATANGGFPDGGSGKGNWLIYKKVLTSDKVYSVVFAPGDAGEGIYSISVHGLIPLDPNQTPLSS